MISEVKQLNLYGTLFYDKLATWIEEMPLNEYFNVKGLNLLKKKKTHGILPYPLPTHKILMQNN